MQEVQPQLQALQKKYAGNKERLAQEQMKLYKEAGVNPLGGCLPSLIQLPIWIGLYSALNSLAHQGSLAGGFLWISDLSFPNTQVGTSWLWPPSVTNPNFLGWAATIGYLVLPILTVVTQVVTQKLMTPTSKDQSQSAMNSAMMLMPFMFGFFALTFPSGLALYWVTSNLFTMIQQYAMGGKPALPAKKQAEMVTTVATAEPAQGAVPETTEKRVPRPTPKKRTRDGRRRRGS
jgi:YidC/Oxa1 family membrane protein insertase